jgi:histidinol-phosphate aminotransferase
MLTRRHFGVLSFSALAASEAAYAKRYLERSKFPSNLTLINSNENPEGPPPVSIEAMKHAAPLGGRYRDDDMDALSGELADLEKIKPEEVMMGSGSSEVLNCAVFAFTSEKTPVITCVPVFELPIETAQALVRPVVTVPLRANYSFDVQRLAEESKRAGGGFIYVCNPNNPTSTVTPAADIDWLVENMHPNAILAVDEAYIHFDPNVASAMKHVNAGRRVIVFRTFSKIYGMAGLRAGFACAKNDLLRKMMPFRSNSISVVAVYAASAAINEPSVLTDRRQRMNGTRDRLCGWLKQQGFEYLEPHANFLMIDVKREVRPVIEGMMKQSVAVGRPFPPLNQMLRVSVGTEADMTKFRAAFLKVMKG